MTDEKPLTEWAKHLSDAIFAAAETPDAKHILEEAYDKLIQAELHREK